MRISDWSSDVCSSDLCLLNAPDVYMDKLAVGPGYSPDIVNFDKSVRENVEAVAREKGCAASDIIVCVLARPRHEAPIAELRALGCGVALIPDRSQEHTSELQSLMRLSSAVLCVYKTIISQQ